MKTKTSQNEATGGAILLAKHGTTYFSKLAQKRWKKKSANYKK